MFSNVNLSREHLLVLVLIAVGLITLFGASAISTAQSADGSDAPAIPATYHGEITINGDPAPTGTTVTAHIDGGVRGTIVIEEKGKYGGAAAADEKLTVDGASDDAGEEITFYIDADGFETGKADQISTWDSGSITELELTATLDVSNGGNGNGGGTGGGGAGSGGGGGGGAAPMPPSEESDEDESEEEPPTIETERVEISEPDETGERRVAVEQTSVSELSIFDDDETDERDSELPTEITVTESSATVEGTTRTYAAVDIDTGDTDTSQMRGTVTMEIPTDDISDAEDSLQMYRNASVETGWEPLGTTVEVDDEVYRVTGETPGFSTFAVAEVVEQDLSDKSDEDRSDEETSVDDSEIDNEETSVEDSETENEEQSSSETDESNEDEILPEDAEDQVGFTIISGMTALFLTYFIIRVVEE